MVGAEPQVGSQFRRIDNFPGVQQSVGIERLLDLTECLVKHWPEHAFLERSPDQAVAVFSTESSPEFENQIGHFVGNGLETRDSNIGLEVDHRPDVQQSDRRVGVKTGMCLVSVENLSETGDVVSQSIGRHGRIFDERDGFFVTGPGHGQSQCRFAEFPDSALLVGVRHSVEACAFSVAGQMLFDPVQAF